MTSVLIAGLVAVLVAGLIAGLVAGASVLLRHVFSEGGVATACSCHDIISVKLTSRQLIDVATSSLSNCCRDILMLSQPLLLANVVTTTRCCRDLIFCRIVVATTFSFKANVVTAPDAGLMSRLHSDVVTSCLLFLQFLVAYL